MIYLEKILELMAKAVQMPEQHAEVRIPVEAPFLARTLS